MEMLISLSNNIMNIEVSVILLNDVVTVIELTRQKAKGRDTVTCRRRIYMRFDA